MIRYKFDKPPFERIYSAAMLCRQISQFDVETLILDFPPEAVDTLRKASAEVRALRDRLNELMLTHYPERFGTWEWEAHDD